MVARTALTNAGHSVAEAFLVSDDASMIRSRLQAFLAGDDDVIIFVGGTGVSPDDLTIETIQPLLQKELPGFGEIFRAVSYEKIGPSAFLSRATAGVAGGKLVVCLPGSPDGVSTALRLFAGEFPDMVGEARSSGTPD